MWKPIKDYPTTTPEQGPVVLVRDADRSPMCALLINGRWHVCPGVPMFYGDQQFGFLECRPIEFMNIPD